jgi:hypothetical protein
MEQPHIQAQAARLPVTEITQFDAFQLFGRQIFIAVVAPPRD